MNFEYVLQFFQEHGYIGVFVLSWIGFIGLPVPNEVIVMTSGMLATKALLDPVASFFMTYLGVISVLTLSYLLGRYAGNYIARSLYRKRKMKRSLNKAGALLNKWGDKILVFSFFIPGLRLIMPFLVGSNRLPFYRFALLSCPAGLVWAFVYFIIGNRYGNHILKIKAYIQELSWMVFGMVFVLLLLNILRTIKTARNQMESGERHPE